MGWFNFQRSEGYPTQYPDQHSPASIDVLSAGLILAFIILGISLLSLLPSFNGKRRVIFFFHVVVSLIVGGIIVLANFGDSWEVGHVKITSPYKAGSSGEVKADLGIYIGLRGINITLNNADKTYTHSKGYFDHETINYNEYFSWEGSQGRFGFGKYAAKIAREFREAVYRGIPIPILQLAEYFTFDGEGIRFGRHYRLAGWYAHMLIWAALPCWLISSILFGVVVRYGALYLMLSGLFQILSVSVWYFTRNFVELQVPYEYVREEVILKTHFGMDFYLVLFNGIFCLVLGFIIYSINAVYPDEMCQFFGIDPLTIYDEYHLTREEIAKEDLKSEISEKVDEESRQGDADSVVRRKSNDQGKLFFKRRTDAASRLFQKSFKIKPKPMPRFKSGRLEEESEMGEITPLLVPPSPPHFQYSTGIYENAPVPRESVPNFPPPPPQVPPRNQKYEY